MTSGKDIGSNRITSAINISWLGSLQFIADNIMKLFADGYAIHEAM